MGQGGYSHAELDGAGPFASIKMHGQTGSFEFVHLRGFEKKRGRDNQGSARSNREYKNNHIAFTTAHNLSAVVNQ